ncbi:MAG: DJ-1/PfpI family protein [Thiobacillus sp.]|jgi:4-methyl-5(b-hydroxyethyl)-thiazole monophosphate biosynthesis|uniref:DJ-1 family glyoxalase III n=1 Tax=unclassified Thiobacillus TaxID=2646513 RepID=UPI00095C6959|nr:MULTISPECIES: DJ-1 family glyoxalase III [unclassified Thiobacillus]MBS0310097.1 DJ-1/PfpI family protein [Pseudomonadota bacterium]MBS0330090.1 DJ-1/PfpI family protein [Pseudomonadota bacterium]OJY60372.1 MAG: DJ-1 family protein [Thiobacillus sp. 0-1251]QLQ04253.1 MAG: DJ-1/PfpI family protein [Thiobacillus sp.]
MAKVLVPLADGCEELEAVTIIDLLRRAGIEVVSAGLNPGVVKASRGVQLVPDLTLDSALQDEYDMVVLPGGMPGAAHLKSDPRILRLLKDMAAAGKYTAAICAAPMVLAEAGVLEGRQATSYPGFLDALPGVTVSAAAVVQDGKVLTSRGPGTAMDFALALIETLAGADKRQQVEAALVRP